MLLSFWKSLRGHSPKTKTAEVDLPTREESEAAAEGLTTAFAGLQQAINAESERLQAILRETSQRIGGPCVTYNDEGEVFVHPDLARELNKPGNEDLRERLLLMGRLGAGQRRRAAARGVNQC